jgi:hypothetical protein
VVVLILVFLNADTPHFGKSTGTVSASVNSPTCNGDVVVSLSNTTTRPTAFNVSSDGAGTSGQMVNVPAHTRNKLFTHKMENSVEVITVDGLGRQLATRKVGRPDGCANQNKINWGAPVAQEDFSQPLNKSDWDVYDSPTADQYPRTPQAVSVQNGVLQLAGGFYDLPTGRKDVSGGIAENYSQKYGKWEVRMKADPGAGYSPVALLWPDTEKWPDDGEIDMIEVPQEDRQVGTSWLHNGPDDDKIQHNEYFDWTQWHTVSVEWLPDSITVSVDGVEQWHVTDSKYIPSSSPMHLALQNDQGSEFSPPRNASTPARVTMYVDWIKVYKVPNSANDK